MYKILKSKIQPDLFTIMRVADKSQIPLDPDNSDYQAYLKWLAEGNTPLPADE